MNRGVAKIALIVTIAELDTPVAVWCHGSISTTIVFQEQESVKESLLVLKRIDKLLEKHKLRKLDAKNTGSKP